MVRRKRRNPKDGLTALLPYAAVAAVGYYAYSQYQKQKAGTTSSTAATTSSTASQPSGANYASVAEQECYARGGRVEWIWNPASNGLVSKCVLPGDKIGI